MEPPQPAATPPGNFDFIVNPEKPNKPGLIGGKLAGNSFITKIIVLVGGAVALIIVLAVAVNIFFGDKTNTETFVGLVQRQQEIVRLSAIGNKATNQEIRNAAINTDVSVISHQLQWMAFLAEHDRVVAPQELSLKKDATIDTRLKTAQETSTFDTTYAATMRTQLEEYATTLRKTYDGVAKKTTRTLLSDQYSDVQLLLEQWPSSSLGLAYY
jgi:hypothetical protein